MFDLKLRDKLLFEDNDFTFSRRYFWAYNSLDSINDSIKAMIRSYSDTFTPDFWLGKHAALWPHPDPEGVEGRNYLAQLGHVRHELESSVGDLRALARSNEQLKEKVEGFREQLYSGSSVKENRIAVEQGENIKILTSLSMLFLPLSFVTVSVKLKLLFILVRGHLLTYYRSQVRVRHAADQHSAQRLAVCRDIGSCLHSLLRPRLRPPDKYGAEPHEKVATFRRERPGRVEETRPGPAQQAFSTAARRDDQEAVLCLEPGQCGQARNFVEPDCGQRWTGRVCCDDRWAVVEVEEERGGETEGLKRMIIGMNV